MKKQIRKITTALISSGMILATVSGSAHAENIDGDITFAGVVPDTCAVVVTRGGVMTVSADQKVLDSFGDAGVSGLAQVATNNTGSTIEVVAPNTFNLAPNGADLDTVFTTVYSADGGTIVEQVQGTTLTPLGLGVTDLIVDATATKTAGTFNSGAYELLVTVRCVTP